MVYDAGIPDHTTSETGRARTYAKWCDCVGMGDSWGGFPETGKEVGKRKIGRRKKQGIEDWRDHAEASDYASARGNGLKRANGGVGDRNGGDCWTKAQFYKTRERRRG